MSNCYLLDNGLGGQNVQNSGGSLNNGHGTTSNAASSAGSSSSIPKNCRWGDMVRDEYDCSVFYHCAPTGNHRITCPKPLQFDTKLKVCNWPAQVRCTSRKSPTSDGLNNQNNQHNQNTNQQNTGSSQQNNGQNGSSQSANNPNSNSNSNQNSNNQNSSSPNGQNGSPCSYVLALLKRLFPQLLPPSYNAPKIAYAY